VQNFLSALGISTAQLNRSAGAEGSNDLSPSFETMLLREIADMVAEANRHGENTGALEREIDFAADYVSALKVRLSKMNQNQRIAFLIRSIRTLPPTRDRSYDVQALADEGPASVSAIVSLLEEIHDEIKRNGFTQTRGAAGKLIDALGCIRDRRALSILQAYVNQPGTLPYSYVPKGTLDHFTRGYAQAAISHINAGKKRYVAIDY
jgi:hypothetical protein